MKIYFAADHAGFELKDTLLAYVRDELGYDVEDCGAYELDPNDDYPVFIQKAAEAVSKNPKNRRAIVLGASGQGEAITANRYSGVRAVVYYGEPGGQQTDASGEKLNMIASTRAHNDANTLSLGARFIRKEEAKKVVQQWLETPFSGEERHVRRIDMLS